MKNHSNLSMQYFIPIIYLIWFMLLVFCSLDQTSLQQIVEIHDLGEAPVSEVLPAPEEQLGQDVLQPQDVHTPVSSTEDEAEDPDNSKNNKYTRISNENVTTNYKIHKKFKLNICLF